MLQKEIIEEKMKERGFTVYAHIGDTKIQFISSHMFNSKYFIDVPKREQRPIINIMVDLNKDEFECRYNVNNSINILKTPKCGSVLNDKHFDSIVCKFEAQAKWLSQIAG